jgi:hypothetical protein
MSVSSGIIIDVGISQRVLVGTNVILLGCDGGGVKTEEHGGIHFVSGAAGVCQEDFHEICGKRQMICQEDVH